MIIQYLGPGVVPTDRTVRGIDGPPPVGTIIRTGWQDLEVMRVEWRLLGGAFRSPKLEAVIVVKQLPSPEDLADDALFEGPPRGPVQEVIPAPPPASMPTAKPCPTCGSPPGSCVVRDASYIPQPLARRCPECGDKMTQQNLAGQVRCHNCGATAE